MNVYLDKFNKIKILTLKNVPIHLGKPEEPPIHQPLSQEVLLVETSTGKSLQQEAFNYETEATPSNEFRSVPDILVSRNDFLAEKYNYAMCAHYCNFLFLIQC